MRYIVMVQHSPDYRVRPTHRIMYDGESLEMAGQLSRHYTRPIDNLRAEVLEVSPEGPGLGWTSATVVKDT